MGELTPLKLTFFHAAGRSYKGRNQTIIDRTVTNRGFVNAEHGFVSFETAAQKLGRRRSAANHAGPKE